MEDKNKVEDAKDAPCLIAVTQHTYIVMLFSNQL
jgi:hypothetical protein